MEGELMEEGVWGGWGWEEGCGWWLEVRGFRFYGKGEGIMEWSTSCTGNE